MQTEEVKRFIHPSTARSSSGSLWEKLSQLVHISIQVTKLYGAESVTEKRAELLHLSLRVINAAFTYLLLMKRCVCQDYNAGPLSVSGHIYLF